MNACEVIRYIIRDAFGWFCLNICVGLPVIESKCCGYVCKLQALARRVRFGLGRDFVTNFRSLSPRDVVSYRLTRFTCSCHVTLIRTFHSKISDCSEASRLELACGRPTATQTRSGFAAAKCSVLCTRYGIFFVMKYYFQINFFQPLKLINC